ncbi:MAG: TRAP transporter substrate-binding protein DctP [bacterium]
MTRHANRAMMIVMAVTMLLLPSLTSSAADRPKYEIKFASVAPLGSSWMNVMDQLDNEVRAATNGDVGFRMYPGGVQGDEPDVLRKMRFGQLQGAGFTGNGLGEILPEMRILELPFLYRDKAEIDYILDRFTDTFDKAFRDKGYVLLGWTEVGYVYFFSNVPIRTIDDVRGIKVWTWQGDPLAAKLFKALNVTPVPLSVTEVLTALQTGMVDAVYTAPMAAISLQWFTRTKYMNLSPLTNSMGAVLMTKNLFDKIPPDEQKALLEISRQKLRELTLLTRRDNRTAIEKLQKAGVEMIPAPSAEELAKYRKVGEEVRQELIGELYPASLLEEIEKTLDEYRSGGQ